MPPLAAPSCADSSPGGLRLSRRALFATSAAGGVVLLAGACTRSSPRVAAAAVSTRQVEALAAQVPVQEGVVAAYRSAAAADPSLAAQVTDLAGQASQQLDRLRAAAPAPNAAPSSAASSAPAAAPGAVGGPPSGREARTWLRTQLAAAADSHAAACLEQSGGRAALLGSVAAGLRGQERRLAAGAGSG